MLYFRNYKIGVTFMSDSTAVAEDRMNLRAGFPALAKAMLTRIQTGMAQIAPQ